VVVQWRAGAPSHTAAALAPVLEAGPLVERQRFDPHAALEAKPGDLDISEVGQGAAMPWQVDGRRWHTAERVTGEGKPARWEGAILDWVDEEVHKLGEFGETNWNQRHVVEVAGAKKTEGWFLHALTGMEWLVRLVFRVGKNRFKGADLVRRLGIRPLNETQGLEVYGNDDRVWVTNHKGPWQSVTVLAHRLSEVDTPAFREFLKEAADSFRDTVRRLNSKPEDVMPWKLNGERWHLGEKGFPPKAKVRWDRALLAALLALVREVEPRLEVRWDNRDHITLQVPGVGRGWASWRTKQPAALDCRFLGKKGQFNLAQVEGLGVAPAVAGQRSDGDVLRLQFVDLGAEEAKRLKAVLAEHLRGFREAFGK
jgi:excinuclease ABC subunit A